MADDEAEIYDGIRAEFPLTFGKQSKSQTPLETIHNATRRSTNSLQQQPSSSAKPNDLPSLSSSSKTWLNSLRTPKRSPNPNPNDSDAPLIGPPRPPPPGPASGDEDDDDDVLIGPPPPPPSGPAESDDDGEMIGPPAPPAGSNMGDSDSDAEEENRYRIPLSNEIVLKGHTKVVSALAVDHTGSRVVSGSYDYSVRMYDFQGMNAKLQSFRQLEPSEGHQVRTISWSPTADRFLCVTGSAQAKVNLH